VVAFIEPPEAKMDLPAAKGLKGARMSTFFDGQTENVGNIVRFGHVNPNVVVAGEPKKPRL